MKHKKVTKLQKGNSSVMDVIVSQNFRIYYNVFIIDILNNFRLLNPSW